jgi:hypothetical protein
LLNIDRYTLIGQPIRSRSRRKGRIIELCGSCLAQLPDLDSARVCQNDCTNVSSLRFSLYKTSYLVLVGAMMTKASLPGCRSSAGAVEAIVIAAFKCFERQVSKAIGTIQVMLSGGIFQSQTRTMLSWPDLSSHLSETPSTRPTR